MIRQADRLVEIREGGYPDPWRRLTSLERHNIWMAQADEHERKAAECRAKAYECLHAAAVK